MSAGKDKRSRRLDRLQNLIIVLLTASAVFLFANLPLFGALSDQSLLDMARDRFVRDAAAPAVGTSGAPSFVLPLRIVYTNDFARIGVDAVTTLGDEFERTGTYLSEALGSAYGGSVIREREFLAALRGKGLYFDFTTALSVDILSELLGISPPETDLESVRRVLLSPVEAEETTLYVQDGAGQPHRFLTAASSAALNDFIAARSGGSADFAFLLEEPYAQLSPYTLILSESARRGTLAAFNTLGEYEETLLRRAEFNAHTENRFTESSGTVIVRETTSALYLRPDGTISYQGAAASPGSVYYVAASGETPSTVEAAAAAQNLVSTMLQDILGDASLYLSGVDESGGRREIAFDLMVDGTPLHFANGDHAATVTVEGRSITAFTLRVRSYMLGEAEPLLLPFAQAAAIARVWDGAELVVAYIDTGAEEVLPAWIAE